MGEHWSGEDLHCARMGNDLDRSEAAAKFGVTEDEWLVWEQKGPPGGIEGLSAWIREGLV